MSDQDKQQRGNVDRDLFDRQLEQYLCGAAAQQGLRGNLASVVASIERGGGSGSSQDPNYAMLRLIGWREGRHEEFDPLHRPAYHLDRLRSAERRFRSLEPKHQSALVAHYVLASRCHETLRASFGEMAGVVLHRWRSKATKTRARDVGIAGAKAQQELEVVRAELAPLERQAAELQAQLDASVLPLPTHDEPEPEEPLLEAELTAKERRAARAQHRAAERAWRAPARFLEWLRAHERLTAEASLEAALRAAEPLRAASARLCAQLAAIAEAQAGADDEQLLVDACRRRLSETDKAALRQVAEVECRAAHRAWRESGKVEAKRWTEGDAA